MATFPRTGSFTSDGDFDTDANWNGVHPSSGSFNLAGAGGNNITSGLNQSASTFARVLIEESWNASIGTGAADLVLGMTSGGTPGANSLIFRGQGLAAYLAGTIEDIYVRTRAGGLNAFHYGNTTAGTATRFEAAMGPITIGANATVTDLLMRPVRDSDVNVTIASGATLVRMLQAGGVSEFSGSGGTPTLTLNRGIFNHNAGTVTLCFMSGGVYYMKAGIITTLHTGDGVLDFTQANGQITIGQIFQGRRPFRIGRNPNFSAAVDVLVVAEGEHGKNVGDTYQLT